MAWHGMGWHVCVCVIAWLLGIILKIHKYAVHCTAIAHNSELTYFYWMYERRRVILRRVTSFGLGRTVHCAAKHEVKLHTANSRHNNVKHSEMAEMCSERKCIYMASNAVRVRVVSSGWRQCDDWAPFSAFEFWREHQTENCDASLPCRVAIIRLIQKRTLFEIVMKGRCWWATPWKTKSTHTHTHGHRWNKIQYKMQTATTTTWKRKYNFANGFEAV